ncbi:MAG: hypothetical protein QOJ23_3074 [Actinomycetota bacterium]|jgi:hypothetical protein|nr:hypothetical protein [Actinomycetota bacterium]
MSPRRLRIIWEPDSGPAQWVVQYDTSRNHWTDAFRFAEQTQAVAYAAEISERDRALLEAER